MGYLFENMEKIDIQEERRKTEEQRRKTEEQRRKTEEQRERADKEKQRADGLERRVDEEKQRADDEREHGISLLVRLSMRNNQDKESIIHEISREFGLDDLEARKKATQYWGQ